MNLLLAVQGETIVDIVALCIIALSAVIGLIRGFAKTFISAFGSIISLILAFLLCSTVAGFSESKFGLITAISDKLQGVLTKIFGETLMDTTLRQATEATFAEAGVAGWIADIVLSVKGAEGVDMNVTLNQVICPVFGYYITALIAIVILYILFRILFFLLGEFIRKLSEIKIIGTVDRTFGFFLGIIKGVIIVQLLILIINVIPIAAFQQLSVNIDNSVLASFINGINIFGIILNAITGIGNIVNVISGAA